MSRASDGDREKAGVAEGEVTGREDENGAAVPADVEARGVSGAVPEGEGVSGADAVSGAANGAAGGADHGSVEDPGAGGAQVDAEGSDGAKRPKWFSEQFGKGRLKGTKNKHPLGWRGLKAMKDRLRMLSSKLAQGDDPKLRRAIRKQLEVISLMYASNSKDGEDFRKSAALAVDLSGYKLEQAQRLKEKVKKQAAKRAATDEVLRRQKLIEREQEQVAKETRF